MYVTIRQKKGSWWAAYGRTVMRVRFTCGSKQTNLLCMAFDAFFSLNSGVFFGNSMNVAEGSRFAKSRVSVA